MNSSRVIYHGITRDKWRRKSFTIYRKIIYCRIASESNARSCGKLDAFMRSMLHERISFGLDSRQIYSKQYKYFMTGTDVIPE